MLGETASSVLEGDRVVAIRVKVDPRASTGWRTCGDLPMRTPDGTLVQLSQAVDVREEPGQLELRRDDARQDVAVTARLEGRDMGSAMAEIRSVLSRDKTIPAGTIEYGGLYEQQRESFAISWSSWLMAVFLGLHRPDPRIRLVRRTGGDRVRGGTGHVRDGPGPLGHAHVSQRRVVARGHHRGRHRRQERHPDARFRQDASLQGPDVSRRSSGRDGGGFGPC